MLCTNSLSSFAVLVLLVCSSLISLSHVTSNGTDHLALVAFRDRITHDPLHVMRSWNDSSRFCHWHGVTCSRMRVTKLNLQSQHLAGSLPPHLGNLTFLQVLNLGHNNLSGHIPPQIGRLFRLRRLSLDNNSFQGQLPGNIARCSNLVYLGLTSNKLTGHISPDLGLLSKLRQLLVDRNSFTGSIPPSLGNLTSLRRLLASFNHLEGRIPSTLGQLKSLSYLGLAFNNLSGPLPPSVYNLSSITTISLEQNQLDGTLSPDLCLFLPQLQKLNLYGNYLTGHIPKSIANGSNLIHIDISMNQFTGQVPSFSMKRNLVALAIYQNDLGSGKDEDLYFLSSLANCTSLQVFIASYNNLGGVLPKSFSNFSTQLSFFFLGGNQIHGTIPWEIGNVLSLTGLDLQGNFLSGTIPDSLAKLQNLGELFLAENQLTGMISPCLGNLTSLSRLHLHNNNLEGEIPPTLGNLQNLELLALNLNNLNGSIPKEIFSLSSLSSYLDLSKNQFTGSLPSEVGKLTMLGFLSLSQNKLSGKVPTTLGACSSLIWLDMHDNLFQGLIPESLSSLRGIEHLDLSSNNLSGPIPKYLESFVFLKNLNLSNNGLQGEVPTHGVFSNATAFSATGNNRLCGGNPQLKLPTCSTTEKPKKHRLSTKLVIVISIASGVVGLTFIASFLYFFLKKEKVKLVSAEETFVDDLMVRLSYDSLLKATDGFSLANLIGKGSFGSVYKGVLGDDEAVVAVKVLNLQTKGGLKSFMAECQTLRGIRHRNLVKVLTACSSIDFQGNDFKALVYEYMSNGSLEEWLHPVPKPELSLHKRVDIAVDVACALNYLHHGSQTPIVHCDLKPSNVLLDSDMTAYLGDFGLAKFLQETAHSSSVTQSSTLGLRGSIGYVAPEYGMGSEVSTYGDVYSYGILMLEMFTGKRPTDDMFKDGLTLGKVTLSALPGQVREIADPMLLVVPEDNPSQVTSSKIEQCLIAMLGIGVACSAEYPSERMDMANVVVQLHHIRNILLSTNN